MNRTRLAVIAATSVLTEALAVLCHEGGHVITGRLAGGSPTLLTATEVLGNFDALSPLGFALFGISGSLVNALFSALGWWVLARRPSGSALRLAAWWFFAVNGMIVGMKMMIEPLAGFGDWMTVLHPWPLTGLLRGVVFVLGTAVLMFLVRRAGAALADIVPPGEASERRAEARRIVLIGALASALLVVGGSIANPVGTTRAMLLALGAGLGPFIPMFSATRFVRATPPGAVPPSMDPAWPWIAGAVLATAVLWFVVGPGIDLSRLFA